MASKSATTLASSPPKPSTVAPALTRDVALGIKDPKSRKEMLNGPYAEEFIAAEMEEIDNLYSMGTFRRIAGTELLRGLRVCVRDTSG